MIFPNRHIIIGQTGDNCVRIAKPASETAAGYKSLHVGINAAGQCSNTGTTIFNSQPLSAQFVDPGFVAATKMNIAYIAEKKGKLFRLQPAEYNIGNNGVLSDLGNIAFAGGSNSHMHNLFIIPPFEDKKMVMYFGMHDGHPLMATFNDAQLKEPNFQPTYSDISTCFSDDDTVVSIVAWPNGSIVEGNRNGADNMKLITNSGVDCKIPSRPKAAFYYAAEEAKRTRTETLPTKTKTITLTKVRTESPTDELTLSDTDNISASLSNSSELSLSSTLEQTHSETLESSSTPTLPPTSTQTAEASSSLSLSQSLSDPNFTQSTSLTLDSTATESIESTSSPSLLDSESLTAEQSQNTTSQSLQGTRTPSDLQTPTVSIPLPPQKVVRPQPATFGEAGLTGTSMFGVVAGAPGIAVATLKLQAAIQLANCGKNEDALQDDMEFLANPFGARLGPGPELQSQRAAAFLNVYFVGIFAALVFIVAVVMTKCSDRTFSQSLMRLRFPGILSLPLAIMIPGTAESTASLWFYSSRLTDWCLAVFATVTVCVGPLFLMGLVTLPGWCRAVLHPLKQQHSRAEEEAEAEEEHMRGEREKRLLSDSSDGTSNEEDEAARGEHKNVNPSFSFERMAQKLIPRPVVRAWYWLTSADREWFDNDKPPPLEARRTHMMKGDVEERGEWTEKYGAVFEDFTVSWAVLVDILAAMALGWCAGVAIGQVSRPACLMWLSACCFISFGHMYFFVVRRPVLTRIRLYFMIFSSIITFITIFLATLQFLGEITGFSVTAGVILDIQVVVGFFAAIIEIISLLVFAIEVWDAYQTGKYASIKKETRNFAIFDDNFLQELDAVMDQQQNHNNNGDGGGDEDEIDIAAILNGQQQHASGENLDSLAVDLTNFLDEEQQEEELIVDMDDDHEDNEIAIDIEPEEEKKNYTEYELEEDGDGHHQNGNSGYLLDDSELDGGNAEDEESARKVGSAQVANALQLKELREMMDKHSKLRSS